MLTENPAVFLRDFGAPWSFGAYPFTGILNAPDDTLNMGGVNVLSTMWLLECLASNVVGGGIVSGSVITYNGPTMVVGSLTIATGQTFTVRDVLSVDDGVFVHLALSK